VDSRNSDACWPFLLSVATRICLAFMSAALLGVPAAAQAKPLKIGGWERVAGAERTLLTDGERYVVTRSAGRVVRLRDLGSTNDARRTLKSPACDTGPALPVVATPAGGGGLVWDCASVVALGGHTFYGQNLTTGRQFVPPGMAEFRTIESQSADGARFRAQLVGLRWIYAIRSGYHYADDVLIGLRAPQAIYNPAKAPDVAVAPGIAAGTRKLCAGIRRTPGHIELGRLAFGPIRYDKPFAISLSQSVARVRVCDGGPHEAPTGRVLSTVGSGRLAWAQGREVRILRSTASGIGRRRAPGRITGLALTRGFVYARAGGRWWRATLKL
jgi:hypothetical protein